MVDAKPNTLMIGKRFTSLIKLMSDYVDSQTIQALNCLMFTNPFIDEVYHSYIKVTVTPVV
jgi:hypothetical protein